MVSEAKSPWIIDVGDADFESKVIARSKELPVVVDFWAPWCAPCRALGPLLEKLAVEKDGAFLLAKVNVDDAQRLAMYFGVEGIPAVKAFRDGEVVAEFVGVYPESELRSFIDRLQPSDADRLAKEAAALEPSNPAEAEKLYRQAIAQDAQHSAAIVGLARLLIARRQDDEAADLLGTTSLRGEPGEEAERLEAILNVRRMAKDFDDEPTIRRKVEANPKSAELRYELGCALAAEGRYSEALATLLEAAELDMKLGSSKVREAMVKIFQVIGVRDPLADEYRDKLTRLLY